MSMLAPDALIIDQPTFAGIWRLVKAELVIYRPTDIYRSSLHERAQARVLRRADAVVATSKAVLDDLDVSEDVPTIVIPNGVDFARFSNAARSAGGRHGAVYVGAIDGRFDWRWLIDVARLIPDVPFRIAGPVARRPGVDLPANIKLLGPISYDETPELMAAAEYGLLPFAPGITNAGRSPMKLYEYLAAGLSVVGPAGVVKADDATEGVYWTRSPEEAAARISTRGALTAESRCADLAQEHDWSVKAALLERFVDQVRVSKSGQR
jgi:glycosyltransferase involved in cell wall biosynthesis